MPLMSKSDTTATVDIAYTMVTTIIEWAITKLEIRNFQESPC